MVVDARSLADARETSEILGKDRLSFHSSFERPGGHHHRRRGGIGLEAAKALQDHGATVVFSDINADRGEELSIEFFPADVTRPAEVRTLAQTAMSTGPCTNSPQSMISSASRKSHAWQPGWSERCRISGRKAIPGQGTPGQ